MKKKLLSLMVALLAITAFATTMSLTMTRRAASELEVVSEATTWDFSKLTINKESALYDSKDDAIKLSAETTPAISDEVVYADYGTDITIGEGFNGKAIAFEGQYPIRKNQYAQNGTLHFKTSVAGKIVVSFNDTGSTASASAVKRYLIVNGTQTEYWTSRENNGDTPYEANLKVTSGEIAVPAGDVTITGSSAIQVSKIVFTPNEGGSGDAETPTTIVYDFAAAAAAGENPDNLNGGSSNGAVFYGWENEGKTYSKRQDYKGYQNYTGTNLPAECHVWRRSDRINGNMTAADADVKGLKCPSQKEMAINGLKAGQKVVIEYSGEGEILYATGFDAANPTAEPNTVAVVGDGNKAAVSGTTTIASGAPIHIVSTDNGYIVFRVLKNMVITKITISDEATPIDPATVVKPNIVTVATGIENGTIKVDKVQAFEGDEVTVTATPAEGYALDAITVMNGETPVELTDGKFIMPAAAVTVSATFVALDMTTLDATITAAEGLLEGKDATVADSPEKTLSDAIAAAKEAKAAAKTQAEIDAANTALQTAIEAYKTATGINGITVDGVSGDIFSDGKPVYNLSGQRVFKGYKGIVIKNGRKVVIK